MNSPENDKWLDEALSDVIGSKERRKDFDQWKLQHPEAVEMLTSRRGEASASPRPLTAWRTVMRSSITKLAAAAVMIIVFFIAVSQFGSSTASVAWGKVARNVEATPGFTYRMRQTHNNKETGTHQFDWMVYVSAGRGIRMDSYVDPEHSTQTYGSLKEQAIISIIHSSKEYIRMPLSGDQLAELEELDIKKSIRDYLSAGYRKLGRKTIDGVEAEGIEIDDPSGARANFQVDSCVAQLWVAVDTGLPILIEADTVGKNGTLEIHTVQDNFQWVELDPGEFEVNIPEDYTQMEVEVEIDGNGRTSYKTTITGKYDSQRAAEK